MANRDAFAGYAAHSSQLSSSLEPFRGKRVVIVGCGATTLQLAPAVAAVAASTTVLRRTMPYVHERKAGRMPANDVGWHAWRTLWEARNDVVTFFDGWVQLEPLVRTWYWLTNYVSLLPACLGGKRVPPEAMPRADQPVQCTRRCYDYCGFMDRVRDGSIALVDVSANRLTRMEPDALLLADGARVPADVVVFATGYQIAKETISYEIDGRAVQLTNATPNVFMPLAGCPTYCVPPRVTEDAMPYFVRAIEQFEGAANSRGALVFYPTLPIFEKRNSVVFASGCSSARYKGTDVNVGSPTYKSDFKDTLGTPVMRSIMGFYTACQRPLVLPPDKADESPILAPESTPCVLETISDDASEPSSELSSASTNPAAPPDDGKLFRTFSSTLGWMHGNSPKRAASVTDERAKPLGGAPLRYLAEVVGWAGIYAISPILGGGATYPKK